MRVIPAMVALAVLVVPGVAAGQSGSPSAEAYYEFMIARRLEAEGDTRGALAALDRAQKLDPEAADLHAERAALHARANDGEQARAAAERALALDPNNVEAHRILGLVFAALSDAGQSAVPGETTASLRARAIEHLAAIVKSPAMATDLSLQLAYGRLLLRSGRTDEAVAILEDVAAQAPYVAEPHLLMAEARTAQGRTAEAAEALARAAAINPRHYVTLGDLYERQGRWAAAAGAYGEAIEGLRAPSRDLRLRWITALINVPSGGGAAQARDALTEMLASEPDDTRLLYLLSTASRQMGDTEGAEAAARKLLAVDPANMRGLNALARSLSSRYAYREVVELLTPVSRRGAARGNEAEVAAALVELGLAHQQLGEYGPAVEVLTAARALSPRDTILEIYLAQGLLSARQFDRADEVTRDALTRAPNDARLLRIRAQALSRSGRAAEAIALLEGAMGAESRSPQLALGLADAYAAARQFDAAVRVVQQAETTFGEDDAFTLRLTDLYEEAGRPEEAERGLRRMIERDPLDATALNYLGYLLAERRERLPEAQALIERALAVEPDNPSFLDSLGWVLFRQGRADAALTPLSKAAAALPANSVIQDHYGDVLAAQGRWPDAVAAWERAKDGDGDSVDVAVLDKKIQDARRR